MIPHIATMALMCSLPTAPPPDAFSTWARAALTRPDLDPWKRSAITDALPGHTYRTATATSYCSACSGGRTCYGERLRPGTAAADRRYWRVRPWAEHAAVLWVDRPREFGGPTLLTLTDVGGAIKGPNRFDLCAGLRGTCGCNAWGRRDVEYVALRGER